MECRWATMWREAALGKLGLDDQASHTMMGATGAGTRLVLVNDTELEAHSERASALHTYHPDLLYPSCWTAHFRPANELKGRLSHLHSPI